ncbi:phage capsid protein [Candidatus Liberibacter asiaticus]|uniref:phage capsid protein n=1 Tax=Liberibacter asiaticus TaxID=34021 RepID=UPI001384DCF6|nr:phage capsid protein [Candidatus Liberibacter asiaticus]KAE9511571.1 hypothetical protein FXW31_00705 [Candidatus Liberibacter asiaticus]
MATKEQLATANIYEFKKHVELALQETKSKLRPTVTEQATEGEASALVEVFKPTEAHEIVGDMPDTIYNATDQDRRWVGHSQFGWAERIDPFATLDSGINPLLPYASLATAAMHRKQDEAILKGMLGVNSLSGKFYEIFNKPLDDWKRFQIDTRTVEGIDPSFHEGIIARYGLDSDVTRVEVCGQFPQQDIDSFIPLNIIEEALNREPCPDPYAPLIMGCDIAEEGGDNTVVVLRRGPVIEHLFDWSKTDLRTTNNKISGLVEKYRPDAIIIDANNTGARTCDYLEMLGYHVYRVLGQKRAVDLEFCRNRRTELHVKMADWLEFASLINHSGLIQNLKSLKSFIVPNTGELAIESKRVKGAKSTDYSDGLMYTFAENPPRSDMDFGRCPSYQYEGVDLLIERRFEYDSR